MFRTKRLNAPPPVSYLVKYYGSRHVSYSGSPTSVVDFSFLVPRAPTYISEHWDPSPELIDEMLKLIKN